ncbi:BON domain-containing protein [Microvirga alba]|uniref:BON domain-containing protein n=1 Tax=Microvirga alba TaxID=2791025 RepID=A0A931FNS5_9HYPH|nr:BON domain-containing protein [Microvirga alba]MBF9234319.1 BON domain-containing protein [Microvirga alba]
MAHRYRNEDRSRYRDRSETRPEPAPYRGAEDQPRPEDDGYIARRGFGNRSAGYDREFGYDDRYDIGSERDFGDSAGYGSGGSTRDWRDVVGEDRRRGETAYGIDYGRSQDHGYYGSSYDYDHERFGTGAFGRGSRDYGEERGFLERAGDEIRSWFGDEEADRRRDMDMRGGGGHRGRGPKGYQRSDARILEDVNDRLTDDPNIDATEIEVTVLNCEVTLAGTVNSRFEKRHAEDIADSVSGVRHVQNNLRLKQYAEGGMLAGPAL